MRQRTLGESLLYARQTFHRLTIGGFWALALPEQVQHNLRWFWFDGLFAAASDNVYLTYLPVFIVALGGTQAQVGLMSSLSSLSAALLLLPGALLAERTGRRKAITLMGGGMAARLMLLLMALAPFLFAAPAVVWIAIALAVLRDAFANLSFPAWASMTGDMIPPAGRGRYLGSRYTVMSLASIAIILIVGPLITVLGAPIGYQVALAIAFALGIISTYCFASLREPPAAPAERQPVIAGFLRGMGRDRVFMVFLVTTALWNFSLNVAGPFFIVYLVTNLRATASMVAITSAAVSVTTLLMQRRWGDLVDRWGARRVMTITMLTIPILPILWMLSRAAWQIIPINLLSGIIWSGLNLASFSLLLHLSPEKERARYSAFFQIVVTVSLGIGAAVGSIVISEISYTGVFLASGVGRLIAALLFVWLLRKA